MTADGSEVNWPQPGALAEAGQTTPEAGPTPAPSAAPARDNLDDPYQCAYCGRPTDPADKRCAHCGRSLLAASRASLEPGSALRTTIFLVGLLVAIGLLEMAPPAFAWQAALGADSAPYQLLLRTPGAALLLGPFLDWPAVIAKTLLGIAGARAALFAASALGLRLRAAPAYYLAGGLLVIDALWNIYRLAGGYIGPAGGVIDLGFGLAALVMLFASDRDFRVVRRRVLVQADRGLNSGLSYHKRGHEYRRLGMWALAVAHWRMAVGAQPREVQYYKDLAVGYAQIGHFDRSLRVLEEAARQAPDDAEITEIAGLVRNRREKESGPRKA